MLLDAASIHRADARGQQRAVVRRRHRVDAHLLPGEDVDRRPGRAAEAAAAPAHPGRHGAAVVDHRHGLHEPQPGGPRRPRVRLHPVPTRRRAQDRRRPRRVAGRGLADRRVGARRGGPRRAAHLRLARFGDNMRDVAVTEGDKVEAQLRFGVSVNTYGVNDLVAVVDAGRRRRHRQAGHRVRRHLPGRARAAAGRRAARVPALRRPHRAGPARVPRRGRLRAPSPRTSRTSAACASCPASPCSG